LVVLNFPVVAKIVTVALIGYYFLTY